MKENSNIDPKKALNSFETKHQTLSPVEMLMKQPINIPQIFLHQKLLSIDDANKQIFNRQTFAFLFTYAI